MCIFEEIDSHPNLRFDRVTMAAAFAPNSETVPAGIMAVRFRAFRKVLYSRQASQYATKWDSEAFPIGTAHTSALLSPIVRQSLTIHSQPS